LRDWAAVRAEPRHLCLNRKESGEQAHQYPEYRQLPAHGELPLVHRLSLPLVFFNKKAGAAEATAPAQEEVRFD
jgi:hypothetical protein